MTLDPIIEHGKQIVAREREKRAYVEAHPYPYFPNEIWYGSSINLTEVEEIQMSWGSLCWNFYGIALADVYKSSLPYYKEREVTRLKILWHRWVAEVCFGALVFGCFCEFRHTIIATRKRFGVNDYFTYYMNSSMSRGDSFARLESLLTGDRVDVLQFIESKLRICRNIFYYGNWGASFGGKRWAHISNCCLKYHLGKWNDTTFADHAFDLQHNGGSALNKAWWVFGADKELPFILELKKQLHTPDLFLSQKLIPLHPMIRELLTDVA